MGKRLGQLACIGRVAQGQCGGGMRVLGVFENLAGKCVLDPPPHQWGGLDLNSSNSGCARLGSGVSPLKVCA